MTVFERAGERVIVLLSSGNLAGTQAVIGVLKQINPAIVVAAPRRWPHCGRQSSNRRASHSCPDKEGHAKPRRL